MEAFTSLHYLLCDRRLLSDEWFEGNVIATGSRVTETKQGQNINFYLFEYLFAYISAFLSHETVDYVLFMNTV